MLSLSIQALKYSLKSRIFSKPIVYYTGSRLGQILHSRLRMQCSSLCQHLYRKNIVDSPNCICGSTESTTHYLFHCTRYTAQMQMHIHSTVCINVLINLTTEILLFGSLKLSPNQNIELFQQFKNVLSVVSDLHHKLCFFFHCFFLLLCTSLSPLNFFFCMKTFTSIQHNIIYYHLKFDIIVQTSRSQFYYIVKIFTRETNYYKFS